MSKSEEFRLKIQQKDHHDYRRRKALEQKECNEADFRDQLRRLGRGDDDQEQGPPVHKK